MNKKLIPLIFIASSALAQTPVSPATPALSKAHPAASPNKIPFSAAAAAQNAGDIGAGSIGEAVRVVDSRGVTLGRYISSTAMLLTYKGQPMAVPLYGDNNYDAPSGGLTWPTFYPLVYVLPGCSGPAYAFGGQLGTRYTGLAIVENGQTYMNVVDEKQGVFMTWNSYFEPTFATCYNNGPADGFLAPVVATVTFSAKTPFFLK